MDTPDDARYCLKPPFWEEDLPLLRQLCTPEELAYVMQWLEDNGRKLQMGRPSHTLAVAANGEKAMTDEKKKPDADSDTPETTKKTTQSTEGEEVTEQELEDVAGGSKDKGHKEWIDI
jgi:hypothetical protein